MSRVDYKFLLDWGVSPDLARFFKPADVKATTYFGLTDDAKDNAVVAVAEYNDRTLITHDKKLDRYVVEHQGQKELHKCLKGLILLPNDTEKETAVLRDIIGKRRALTYKGKTITWDDVWRYNLYAPLTRPGDPPISALCVCGEKAFDKHHAEKSKLPRR